MSATSIRAATFDADVVHRAAIVTLFARSRHVRRLSKIRAETGTASCCEKGIFLDDDVQARALQSNRIVGLLLRRQYCRGGEGKMGVEVGGEG